MKNLTYVSICAALLTLTCGAAMAQDYDYHPMLSDRFVLGLGAFGSNNSFKISADGRASDGHRVIDFGNSVGVDESSTILNSQLTWKFGQEMKWRLSGQFFDTESSGEGTLNEDVEWNDGTFLAGSSIGGGADIQIIRAFVGRTLVKTPQTDMGIGAGLHNLKMGAFLAGDAALGDGSVVFRESEVSSSQPLPNLGAWYQFSPSKDWLLHGRVDWISANVGELDGTLWNISGGVNYQFSRHFGADLSFQYFDLDVGVSKDDWNGGVNMSYTGPVLSLVGTW